MMEIQGITTADGTEAAAVLEPKLGWTLSYLDGSTRITGVPPASASTTRLQDFTFMSCSAWLKLPHISAKPSTLALFSGLHLLIAPFECPPKLGAVPIA